MIFLMGSRQRDPIMLGRFTMLAIFNPLLRLYRRLRLTPGEQSILLAFFGVGLFGAVMAVNVMMTLGGVAASMTPFSAYDYWIILSGAVGACIGLFGGRDWLGHSGARGAMKAAIGMLWISFMGGLVGGSLALPLYGTMFGPFTLFVSLFSAPFLALFWGCILIAAHLLLKIWRNERDSIFNAAPTERGFQKVSL